MAFRDQTARGIDSTFPIDRGFSVDPILSAFAVRGFPKDLGAQRSHHREAIVDLRNLDILWLDSRHLVGALHCLDRARRAKHITTSFFKRVGGLRIASNLDAVLFLDA